MKVEQLNYVYSNIHVYIHITKSILSLVDERQFEEDAIILKVIEAYCLSVNARFTVHSGESTCKLWFTNSILKIYNNVYTLCIYILAMLEYDSHKMRDRTSLTHNRNWDFCSNR